MTDIRAEDVYRAIAVLREHCGNLYDTYGFAGSYDLAVDILQGA